MIDALYIVLSGTFGTVAGPVTFVHHACVDRACAFIIAPAANIGPLQNNRYYIVNYTSSNADNNYITTRLPVRYGYIEEVIPDASSPIGFREAGVPLGEGQNVEVMSTLYASRDTALADLAKMKDQSDIQFIDSSVPE